MTLSTYAREPIQKIGMCFFYCFSVVMALASSLNLLFTEPTHPGQTFGYLALLLTVPMLAFAGETIRHEGDKERERLALVFFFLSVILFAGFLYAGLFLGLQKGNI